MLGATKRLVGAVGTQERQVDAVNHQSRRTSGKFVLDKLVDGAKWLNETRGRKIGASLLTLGAGLGVLGTNEYHNIFPSEDKVRPAVTALIGLQAKHVTDTRTAKRIDLEHGGGIYDPTTHELTLDLKNDKGNLCEAPITFVVATDYSSLSLETVYQQGKTTVGQPMKTPGEIYDTFTQFLNTAGCVPKN